MSGRPSSRTLPHVATYASRGLGTDRDSRTVESMDRATNRVHGILPIGTEAFIEVVAHTPEQHAWTGASRHAPYSPSANECVLIT